MESKCYHCGKSYETKRESSLYCSNGCRTSAYKYRKRCELFEKEEQEIRQAQKLKDDQQKLLDNEKRKEKAVKRRKAKEDKALKAEQEKVANSENVAQQDLVKVEPDVQTQSEQKLPEEPETKNDAPKYPGISKVQWGKKHLTNSSSGSTNQPGFWDVVVEIAKIYIDYKNKK